MPKDVNACHNNNWCFVAPLFYFFMKQWVCQSKRGLTFRPSHARKISSSMRRQPHKKRFAQRAPPSKLFLLLKMTDEPPPEIPEVCWCCIVILWMNELRRKEKEKLEWHSFSSKLVLWREFIGYEFFVARQTCVWRLGSCVMPAFTH